MGIEARHSYRFGYLKSEHWQNLRLEKLAEVDARCFFCNHRDIKNDVHHAFYPDNLYNTTVKMLRVLCRTHHERIHELMKEVEQQDPSKNKKSIHGKEFSSFRTFRLAAVKLEREMQKSGLKCCTHNGTRKDSFRVNIENNLDKDFRAKIKSCRSSLIKIVLLASENPLFKGEGIHIICDPVISKMEEMNFILENSIKERDRVDSEIKRKMKLDYRQALAALGDVRAG